MKKVVGHESTYWQAKYNKIVLDEKRTISFINAVSHDLKNPLASVRLMTQLLSGKLKKSDPRLVEFTNIIMRQNSKMINIVNDLLDITRIKEGKMTLNKKPIKFEDIVDSAIETMKTGYQSHKIIKKGHATLIIPLDKSRMIQVIENLLNNAIKYSPPHSIIVIKLEQTPKKIRLSIIDHGIGIEKNKLKAIFKQFYQAEKNHEGLGMGLFIANKIILEHGGKIDVKSVKGKGSIFYLELPC